MKNAFVVNRGISLANLKNMKIFKKILFSIHFIALASWAQDNSMEGIVRDDKIYTRSLRSNADILKPSQRKSSYQQLILKGEYDRLDIFDHNCLRFIKDIYGSGKNFRSQVLEKQLYPLKNEKFLSGIHERWFFHYTRSDSMVVSLKEAFKKNSPSALDEFYIHTRTHARDTLTWFTNLFLAEDPVSSSSFGSRQVRLDLFKGSKVLRPTADIWQKAYDEIVEKYPEAKRICPLMGYPMASGFDGYGERAVYSSLSMLMAEDSGVDLISYGYGSTKSATMLCRDAPANSVCGRWYQIINPTIIFSVGAP